MEIMERKGCVIAGLAGGSGKSVVSVGLTAVLRKRGFRVVPFKKGPDYIDAGWLRVAANHRCYNLDPYLVQEDVLRESFYRHAVDGDIAILEGNRGLYDGVTSESGYSTADLAVMLELPVFLVVNCTKTTRTVAAMVLGCLNFDPRVSLQGVILNQVATERQRLLITEAVENTTHIPVVGAIPRMHKDIFPMRHLGMIPYQEYGDYDEALVTLVDTVTTYCDVDTILERMRPVGQPQSKDHVHNVRPEKTVKIGVLQDAAFQFYYSENLEALEREGAELISINAMNESSLPAIDGLYIGGGFPETNADALSKNTGFLAAVKDKALEGLPIYAECGGLIYLGASISMDEKEFPLVGLFPIRFGMSKKPQAHGYSGFIAEKSNPFYEIGTEVRGHEFRYSTIQDWQGTDNLLTVRMQRGRGFIHGRDGLCIGNTFATYTHIHADGVPHWAKRFVQVCQAKKEERISASANCSSTEQSQEP